MAQVKPMGLIESMSGKVCEHSDMYFFRKNGKVFSGKICNPSTKEPTENQLAAQAKFKTARTNAMTALADPEQKAALSLQSTEEILFPLWLRICARICENIVTKSGSPE